MLLCFLCVSKELFELKCEVSMAAERKCECTVLDVGVHVPGGKMKETTLTFFYSGIKVKSGEIMIPPRLAFLSRDERERL